MSLHRAHLRCARSLRQLSPQMTQSALDVGASPVTPDWPAFDSPPPAPIFASGRRMSAATTTTSILRTVLIPREKRHAIYAYRCNVRPDFDRLQRLSTRTGYLSDLQSRPVAPVDRAAVCLAGSGWYETVSKEGDKRNLADGGGSGGDGAGTSAPAAASGSAPRPQQQRLSFVRQAPAAVCGRQGGPDLHRRGNHGYGPEMTHHFPPPHRLRGCPRAGRSAGIHAKPLPLKPRPPMLSLRPGQPLRSGIRQPHHRPPSRPDAFRRW